MLQDWLAQCNIIFRAQIQNQLSNDEEEGNPRFAYARKDGSRWNERHAETRHKPRQGGTKSASAVTMCSNLTSGPSVGPSNDQ